MAKVLKCTVKSKKSKLITVKRTVIVCAIVAATPTSAYPHLTTNKGKVQCLICNKDIKVGIGGVQNF